MMIELLNCDCMKYMESVSDKFFDLAIVDPPYGLGKRTTDGTKNSQSKFMKDIRRTNWDDKKPCSEYFFHLNRISENRIVWGGNYFGLPAHRCFIVWDKMTYIPSMSQVEQAWTSFDSPARYIRIDSTNSERIHPTQKPVKLYKWLLKNYAKEGDKIFDSHLGSGSIAIACHDLKFDLVGCEIDKDYYEAAVKRFENHKKQLKLF